jgi:hypothetical protein
MKDLQPIPSTLEWLWNSPQSISSFFVRWASRLLTWLIDTLFPIYRKL